MSRVRAGDAVRRSLEESIASGTLAPGDRLDEQMLAKQFDVSRTPAREALLQLATAGHVRLVPRYGAVVLGITPELALGMVEVLTALEAEAAGLAARRMTATERSQLATIHEASRAKIDAADRDGYIRDNETFHQGIYDGARNRYLMDQVKAIRARMRFGRQHSLQRFSRLGTSWTEHDAIVAAIGRHDDLGARDAMRAHILAGGTVYADMVAAAAHDGA